MASENRKKLLKLYNILLDAFSNIDLYKQSDSTRKIQKLSKKSIIYNMLINNGCITTITEDSNILYTDDIIASNKDGSSYNILIIYGMKGNEYNEFFDYIEYGNQYIVLFIDAFKDINKEPSKENDMDLFGRSKYIDMIKYFIELFINTSSNIKFDEYRATVTTRIYRTAPTLMALSIIDKLYGLTENDIDVKEEYDNVKHILDTIQPEMFTLGITVKE